MTRRLVLGLAALAFVAAGVVVATADHLPPARVWALESNGADHLPMPMTIAAFPGGEALDDFDLSGGCGGGGMGGNVIYFLPVRRNAVSRWLDVVRDPPLATLGYGRRNHVVKAEGGDWRELVRRTDDGTEPPVEGGTALAGSWEHVAGDGRTTTITLRADGTLDIGSGEGDGQGDWTRTGTTLVLAVTIARDGIWPTGPARLLDHAVCNIAADAGSYTGSDESGRAVSGRRSPGR
ncbi:MAG: hypothetical protein K8T90_21260 [Planctomycetes bacterium]|nr:hypothetical protein [Planctomycetota bacterium]